jgi:hypothetical protein
MQPNPSAGLGGRSTNPEVVHRPEPPWDMPASGSFFLPQLISHATPWDEILTMLTILVNYQLRLRLDPWVCVNTFQGGVWVVE